MTQFIPYSIGIAAENKPLNTRDLNVTPIEILSALDGELKHNPEEVIQTGTDSEGNHYEVRVIQDITLTATWLPSSSNRVTAPDIRRGELIEIYRLADTDRFYWRCMGLSDHLRRLETIIFAINGSPDENAKGIDFETCYFIELSTHQRQITLSTSQANGEPFRYTFQFNTAEGYVNLTDDVGNHVILDSTNTLIHLENIAGSMVELNKEDIHFVAPRNLTGKVGNDATLEVGNDLSLSVGNNATIQVGNNLSQTVGQNQTETVGGNATQTVAGNITVTSLTYAATASQGMTLSGTTNLTLGAAVVGITAVQGMSVLGASVSMGSEVGEVELKGNTVEVVGTTSASLKCGPTELILTPAGAVLKAATFAGESA